MYIYIYIYIYILIRSLTMEYCYSAPAKSCWRYVITFSIIPEVYYPYGMSYKAVSTCFEQLYPWPRYDMGKIIRNTVELQWLEHLWNHENIFETKVVRAIECLSQRKIRRQDRYIF